MDIFPARLKAARKAARLTQRELADRTGMDQGHISRLESGGKGVSMEHLQELAKALNITVSYLIGENVKEEKGGYNATGTRGALLLNYDAPAGLRELAGDTALAEALNITETEWKALASIQIPGEVSKDGYVQLLITIRAVSD